MTCINVKICVKNQDISLFQSYTSVSSKLYYVYIYIYIYMYNMHIYNIYIYIMVYV